MVGIAPDLLRPYLADGLNLMAFKLSKDADAYSGSVRLVSSGAARDPAAADRHRRAELADAVFSAADAEAWLGYLARGPYQDGFAAIMAAQPL